MRSEAGPEDHSKFGVSAVSTPRRRPEWGSGASERPLNLPTRRPPRTRGLISGQFEREARRTARIHDNDKSDAWAEIKRATRHYIFWQFISVPISIVITVCVIGIFGYFEIDWAVPYVMIVLFVCISICCFKWIGMLAWIECPNCTHSFHGLLRAFVVPFGLVSTSCRNCGIKIGTAIEKLHK
jgi:hypothetical protein